MSEFRPSCRGQDFGRQDIIWSFIAKHFDFSPDDAALLTVAELAPCAHLQEKDLSAILAEVEVNTKYLFFLLKKRSLTHEQLSAAA